MKAKDILKRPIITEKSMKETAWGKFAFEVDSRATKTEVARVVGEFFGVHPVSVKIINVKGKTRRSKRGQKKIKLSNWKKAIVTLKEGEKIDIFEMSE